MSDNYIENLIRKLSAPKKQVPEPVFGYPGAYDYPKAIAFTLNALSQHRYGVACDIASEMDVNYMVEINPLYENKVPVDAINILYYASTILAFMANCKHSHVESSLRRLLSRDATLHQNLLSIQREAAKDNTVYGKIAHKVLYDDTDLHELL